MLITGIMIGLFSMLAGSTFWQAASDQKEQRASEIKVACARTVKEDAGRVVCNITKPVNVGTQDFQEIFQTAVQETK